MFWLALILLSIVATLLFLVVGTIAAVVGTAIAAVQAMPWLLILVGAWLLLRSGRGSGRPRRRGAERRARPRSMTVPAAAWSIPVRPKPAPATPPRRELPIDVQVKVEQIRRKADVLLGFADRFPPFSQDLHLVRQTAADYLPRTVEAYLALPGDDDPLVGASGKTARQELVEQVELLDSKLDEIAQDLQRQDLDRLLANRRFLEERFRLRDGEPRVASQPSEIEAA